MPGSEYVSGFEYARFLKHHFVLNMSGFGICQGYEYARVTRLLNMPEYA